MKKRKHQKDLQTQNESTHFDINDVQIQQFENQHSENIQHNQNQKISQQFYSSGQTQNTQKTCAQSLKQKLQYFWVQMINYLQFDRVLSQDEIELLKKENYTIKTKYPDNYHLTYPQRSKTFGISLEEITRMKMQEEQIKNKNFWNEVKRFICCHGGNELEETDEMLTAASQTQYFYLNKMKKTHKNSLQITEQAFIEKPFSKMTRQEISYDKQIYNKSNDAKEMTNIFQEDDYINQHKDQFPFKYNSSKNTKQIDMNTVRTIKKKSQKSQESDTKNKQDKLQNEKNDIKLEQKNSDSKNQKQIKDTQKIYIQKRQNLNSNRQNFEKLEIRSEDKEDHIDEVFIDNKDQNVSQARKKDLTGHNQKLNQNQKQSNQKIPNIQTQINDSENLNKNYQQSKKFKEQQSTNPSSPNPSFQKFTPNNTSNLQGLHFNLQENSQQPKQKFNFSHLENSDNISIAQSQNKEISDDFKMKKNHKRQRSKLPKQEPFLDLKVIQHLVEDQDSSKIQEQSIDNNLGRKKYSFSSQQLSKKSKKRPFNVDQFDQTINEGLEEELQKSFNMQFGGNKDTIKGDSNSNIYLSKKKKTRNKNLFNLRQQNEKTDEVIIFEQNQQNKEVNQNDQNSYAHTIDVSLGLNSQGMGSSANIKKRKKAKKLKDFNTQKDDYNVIVIEGEQNAEENIDENNIQKNNGFSTTDLQQNPTGLQKADKKRKKKTRLREEIQKQQQFEIVDLGEIN